MCGPPPNKTWKLRGAPPNRRFFFLTAKTSVKTHVFADTLQEEQPKNRCAQR